MALDFPSNPVQGQIYNNFYYDANTAAWRALNSLYAPNFLKDATFSSSTTSRVPLTVQGVASQSANLQEWENSSGTVLSSISSGGSLSTSGSYSSSAQNTLSRFNATNTSSANDQFLYLLAGTNDTGIKAVHFINSSTRISDGGANTYTIRNDGGPLVLGQASQQTTVLGRTLNPNQPAFYARGPESSMTLANGGDVTFNNAEVNIGNHFNTSNFRFTAPVAGMYQINTTLFNNGGGGRVSIKVNNAAKYNSQNNWDTSWCWAGTIYLNANDYVTVGDWQSLGGAVIYLGHSSFSGFLVG
jgi:hypothetical protein